MPNLTALDWLVILGGISAIVWVNWYFLFAGRALATAALATANGAMAEIVITVDGGYSPAQIRVAAGAPVRLIFDRKDDSSCSEEVVLPAFNVRRFLPSGQRTSIEVTPAAAGRYEFTCGMGMLRGAIIAEG